MKQPIYPCLWFEGNAKTAASFYCSIFHNSSITIDTPMVVNFTIGNQKFMGLNGGPMFKINPSVSLFVLAETKEEVSRIWNELLVNGTVMMALDKYPWSEWYGFLQDQFGVSWQIYLGTGGSVPQLISPCFMFTGTVCGRAEEAIHFYTSIFKNSSIKGINRNGANDEDKEGYVKHADFTIDGYSMMALDSSAPHKFEFNEAFSLMIECETQEEIDFYWNALVNGGRESRCGWLKDKFGISWQVIPSIIGKLMSDPIKAPKVMQAVMQMNKLDIALMLQAFEN